MCINKQKKQAGISLIELILFIVIVGVSLAGLLLTLNTTTVASVDPLMRKQALAIAESLLEEVQLHDFSNPDGGFTGAATQANRASFDDIGDYNGFATNGIYPANGSSTVIAGLEDYDVSINVSTPLAANWNNIPAASAARITVTVTMPDGNTIDATGYRVDY